LIASKCHSIRDYRENLFFRNWNIQQTRSNWARICIHGRQCEFLFRWDNVLLRYVFMRSNTV